MNNNSSNYNSKYYIPEHVLVFTICRFLSQCYQIAGRFLQHIPCDCICPGLPALFISIHHVLPSLPPPFCTCVASSYTFHRPASPRPQAKILCWSWWNCSCRHNWLHRKEHSTVMLCQQCQTLIYVKWKQFCDKSNSYWAWKLSSLWKASMLQNWWRSVTCMPDTLARKKTGTQNNVWGWVMGYPQIMLVLNRNVV